MEKINCWEHRKCGREPGGINVAELGICPATIPGEGSGSNSGRNRGRICWAISGTLCGGKAQGTYAKKQYTCLDCFFYEKVKKEEGKEFRLQPLREKEATEDKEVLS